MQKHEMSMAFQSYEKCKEIPKTLTADDGRVFIIRSWSACASTGELSHVRCELIPQFTPEESKVFIERFNSQNG